MSLVYEIRKNEYGDILGCDSCSAEVPTEKFDNSRNYPKKEQKKLCSLCSETFIGNAHEYPEQYSFVTPVMLAQAIHWLNNQAIERAKNEKSSS